MFGLKIVTQKKLEQIEITARYEAMREIIALLQKAKNIYLEPVTLVGDHQTIQDCAFLGGEYGLVIRKAER